VTRGKRRRKQKEKEEKQTKGERGEENKRRDNPLCSNRAEGNSSERKPIKLLHWRSGNHAVSVDFLID
jgi:hypothetical protein